MNVSLGTKNNVGSHARLVVCVFVLNCSVLVSYGYCEKGKPAHAKKTPIVHSTPTSVPASKVKLFSAIFFEETCRYFDKDGWGAFMLPVVSEALRGGAAARINSGKCSPCRALVDRFARGCKRAIGVMPQKHKKAVEPGTEFIHYLSQIIHNSQPPLPEETKTFLTIMALAYQKASPDGKEYFSILDSYIGPPLLAILSQAQESTPPPK